MLLLMVVLVMISFPPPTLSTPPPLPAVASEAVLPVTSASRMVRPCELGESIEFPPEY